VVSTVCHGGAALLAAELPDGTPLVRGQEVTAFSNEEEKLAQGQIGAEYLPFYLEDELGKRGAAYRNTAPYQPFVVVSGGGRLITGQQNFSGLEIGRKLVEVLKGGAQ
jgi:putative intracellular protease/amidase